MFSIKFTHNSVITIKEDKQICTEDIKKNIAIRNIIGKSTPYKHTVTPIVLGHR